MNKKSNELKLTKKEALRILIKASSRDIIGAGKGYRSTSNKWRKTVSEAIIKLYKDAYNRNIKASDKYNLHIY